MVQEYADRRNIQIVRTYADEDKSGLSIDGRASLQRLITDVESGNTDFNLILVYVTGQSGIVTAQSGNRPESVTINRIRRPRSADSHCL
jgi:hypothetical protein